MSSRWVSLKTMNPGNRTTKKKKLQSKNRICREEKHTVIASSCPWDLKRIIGCDFWIVDQHRNVMLVPKHGKIGSVGATTDDSVLRACHKHIQRRDPSFLRVATPSKGSANVWPGLSQGDVAKEEKQATRQNRGSIHPSPFTLVPLPPPVGWVKLNNPSSGISRGANLEACPNLDKSPEQCPLNLGCFVLCKLWDSIQKFRSVFQNDYLSYFLYWLNSGIELQYFDTQRSKLTSGYGIVELVSPGHLQLSLLFLILFCNKLTKIKDSNNTAELN
jgi:hypothetical protein